MSRHKSLILSITFFASLMALSLPANEDNPKKKEKSPSDIFEERIMPIFRSEKPSSCVQCHLSSVDLKNYILPSHEKTFASLRDQELINLDHPEKSEILKLIAMGDRDKDKGAKLIHEKMRKAEFEAFSAWIKASCGDDKMRNLPALKKSERAKPPKPNEVIRYTRKSRVLDSFVRKIWSQRMRCFPCHTPNEIGPRQAMPRKKYEEWKSQFGEQMAIFKKTPEETLQYLVEQSKSHKGKSLPMLDLVNPPKSLIVVKPTSKLPPVINGKRTPTYKEPVYHMGGLKMHDDDHSYKMFVSWISDYAKVTKGEFQSVDELPSDNWYPTQRILRMRNVPEQWKTGTPIQLFVYAKNAEGKWTEQPLAFTQGTVTPRHIVNGPLILFAPTEDKEFAAWKKKEQKLPQGDYLVKVFVDTDGTIAKDPSAMLDMSSFKGSIEVTNAVWQVGFPNATWISGKSLFKQ